MIAITIIGEVLVSLRRDARLFELLVCRRREGTRPDADGDQPIEISLAR
jgi:hypothetical protein